MKDLFSEADMAISGNEYVMQGQKTDPGEVPVATYLVLCLASLLVFSAAQWISDSMLFPVPRAAFAGLLAGHLCLRCRRCIAVASAC
ncbi:hypothetical protein [Noviherbaspirillum saxi]|uniref:hypothetical protein n=1 Tax=Noviherbaspirillum saxi TaxID=2320863 RepID=UPI0011C40352|nr:hypothetical protein [Noviherbaspirillum saxi]